MDEGQITDSWNLFKEYLDKKQIELVAEKYVDLLADYGVEDQTLIATLGSCPHLDNAINYYLDMDDELVADDEVDWDE
jgi:hypothetical protein|tara:strand:- start:13690 stop:13923 length:234 start_codon:yes stop_codon:yes gene_type:complete